MKYTRRTKKCDRLIKLIHGKPTMRVFRYRAVFCEPTDWSKVAAGADTGSLSNLRARAAAGAGAGQTLAAPTPAVTIEETEEVLPTADYLKS
jgi:hypothetical protein